MEKILLVALIVMALVGCGSKDKDIPSEHKTSSSDVSGIEKSESDEKVIKYQTPDKKEFILKTNDNFVTATLIDDEGKSYTLKEVPAASGMRLEGNDGVAIHTKNGQGIIEFSKDNYFSIEEVN